MKRTIRFLLFVVTLSLLFSFNVQPALAQDYYFELAERTTHVFWEADGTLSLHYTYVFNNEPSGHSIEYVDVAMPRSGFDMSSAWASVDGIELSDISTSNYEGDGSGFAVGLGSHAIPPGDSGTVTVFIGGLRNALYPDDDDPEYASAVFAPNTFYSSIVSGSTNVVVIFHLPPGVQPDEPRWHAAPGGFNAEPETGIDEEGRIVYLWRNPNANAYSTYSFGASFPAHYVPESAIVRRTWLDDFFENVSADAIFGFCIFGLIIGIAGLSSYQSSRRQMQYLPPKIRLEGHGIKRGLTAIEAAVLLEQPLDRILTMILFAVIKKDAARVFTEKPIELEFATPLPEGLHPYEVKFLEAFREKQPRVREKLLQTMMIELVKSVSGKLKGFSAKETSAYYRSIVERAWDQVRGAATPEVKSQKFDETMEWMMLDRNFEGRTREVFSDTPVYVPRWWGNYSPTYRTNAPAAPSSSGSPAMPVLPGADFAASIVNQVQGFSGQIISSVSGFTSNVTARTNPPPVSTSSGSSGGSRSGGGSSCACACACAGCACACAGGGR